MKVSGLVALYKLASYSWCMLADVLYATVLEQLIANQSEVKERKIFQCLQLLTFSLTTIDGQTLLTFQLLP